VIIQAAMHPNATFCPYFLPSVLQLYIIGDNIFASAGRRTAWNGSWIFRKGKNGADGLAIGSVEIASRETVFPHAPVYSAPRRALGRFLPGFPAGPNQPNLERFRQQRLVQSN
jgi:hypothetical protein